MTKRKASRKPIYIAPDTDVLLHFKRPDTIDWASRTPGREITLIFVSNTLREIEQHKDGMKAGRRDVARDINSWLRRVRKGEVNAQGCQIVLHPVEPSDFSGGLDSTTGDDRFVASLRELASQGKDVVAYTNDFLCQTKAERLGLKYIEPLEQDARPLIKDEYDERLKKLEKTIASKPTPMFDLEWNCGGNVYEVSFSPVIELVDVDVEATELPEFVPVQNGYAGLFETKLPNPARIGNITTQQGRIRTPSHLALNYNKARQEYLEKYQRFVNAERDRLSRRSRRIDMAFRINNVGTAPASNVRITATLPKGVWIPATHPPEGSQSELPPPPHFPVHNSLYRINARFSKELSFHQYSYEQNPLHMTRLSSQTMEARRNVLQHGDAWVTSKIVVVADEELAGHKTAINFQLWADEIPEPSKFELVLAIQPRG